MRVIRVWYVTLRRADYRYDRWGCYYPGDYVDDEYYYSREEALSALRDRAEDFRKEWSFTERRREEGPADVGTAWSVLVPIKDDVTLPHDASDLLLPVDDDYTPMYLDTDHVDIAIEHEFPWIGKSYDLFEDGDIVEEDIDDAEIHRDHPLLSEWKSRGWDGTVEEVTTA